MRNLIMVLLVLFLSGCMTKASIQTETVLADGSKETCSAEYMNFKDSATTSIGGCGASGTSEGSTSNTILMELLLRGLQAPQP